MILIGKIHWASCRCNVPEGPNFINVHLATLGKILLAGFGYPSSAPSSSASKKAEKLTPYLVNL